MVDEDNREQVAIDAESAADAKCDTHSHDVDAAAEVVPDEPAVQVGAELDELSMVELVPQPEIEDDVMTNVADVPVSEPADESPSKAEPVPQVNLAQDSDKHEAEVAAVEVAAESDSAEKDAAKQNTEQKNPGTNSGIALPSFVDRSETGVFGATSTKTGIPLPPRANNEPNDSVDKAVDAAMPEEDAQFPEPQQTVLSKHVEVKAVKEIEKEHSEVRAEFSDENSGHTQMEVEYTRTEVEEPKEEALSARQLGAALTASSLASFEPLLSLNEYPHLYTVLLDIKGVWQSTVSMDELMVAAARSDQSDRRNEEVKNWYTMRIKKLVVNALDFVWIAQAYNIDGDGLMIIDDEQLFTSLTGIKASEFKEMCSRGLINRNDFMALVQQFKLWEAEAFSPADYIFSHLRMERMVA